MNDAFLYVAIVVAIAALVYAVITKREVATFKALADNAGGQAARLSEKMQKLEQGKKNAETSLEQIRSSQRNFDKKVEEFKRKISERDQKIAELGQQGEQASTDLQRRIDILTEEKETITNQLAEAVAEKKALSDAASKHSAETSSSPKPEHLEKAKSDIESLKQQLNQARKENKSFRNEVEKAREILRKVNPGELKRTKAKLSQVEQLYRSMKGLKEMTEERNENWQQALRYMAAHINGKDLKTSEPLGPLVGEALQKIGKELVVDEHSTIGATGQNEADMTASAVEESKIETPKESPVEAGSSSAEQAPV